MKKELCKPCAIALENRGKTVKAGWPHRRKKEDKLT